MADFGPRITDGKTTWTDYMDGTTSKTHKLVLIKKAWHPKLDLYAKVPINDNLSAALETEAPR